MYGISPAVTLSGTIAVIYTWHSLRAVTFGKELEAETMTRARMLLIILPPYGIFLIFLIASIVVGSSHPELVLRDRVFFYCSINSHIDVGAITVSGVFGIITTIFEVWTLLCLNTRWDTSVTDMITTNLVNLPNSVLAFNVKFIKRTLILSVLFILISLLALLEGFFPSSVILSALPRFNFALWILGLALILATQPSILRVWMFWKPRKPRTELDSFSTTFAIVADGSKAGSPIGPKRSGTLMSIDATLHFGHAEGFGNANPNAKGIKVEHQSPTQDEKYDKTREWV